MKVALLLLALVTSSQVFAFDESTPLPVLLSLDMTSLPTNLIKVTSNLSSGTNYYKEATQVIKDANEYAHAGTITPFLNQAIVSVQENNSELSVSESVDVLVDAAQNILKDL